MFTTVLGVPLAPSGAESPPAPTPSSPTRTRHARVMYPFMQPPKDLFERTLTDSTVYFESIVLNEYTLRIDEGCQIQEIKKGIEALEPQEGIKFLNLKLPYTIVVGDEYQTDIKDLIAAIRKKNIPLVVSTVHYGRIAEWPTLPEYLTHFKAEGSVDVNSDIKLPANMVSFEAYSLNLHGNTLTCDSTTIPAYNADDMQAPDACFKITGNVIDSHIILDAMGSRVRCDLVIVNKLSTVRLTSSFDPESTVQKTRKASVVCREFRGELKLKAPYLTDPKEGDELQCFDLDVLYQGNGNVTISRSLVKSAREN